MEAQYAGFIELKGWLPMKEGFCMADIRLSPLSISSYYNVELNLNDDKGAREVVVVICGGVTYYVDMPLKVFDKFIDSVKIGFQINDQP